MTTTQASVHSGRVATEGDELYYEVRGQGQPLLMIPAAGGDGDYYGPVAELLADEYKVITYDRRANSRSTMNEPQNFEISQQSRDGVAVLRAAGEESAFVFGNSSGAVIALDMASTQPQAVRAVIVHEAPLARLHPNARHWQRTFASAYMTGWRFSSTLGALQFMLGAKIPLVEIARAQSKIIKANQGRRQQADQKRISDNIGIDFLIKQELLPVTSYLPDIEKIKQNRVKVFLAVGQWGLERKAWYVVISQILAQRLGCELVVFPGHHGSYMDMPVEWAAALRRVLQQAEGLKVGNG